MNKSHFEGYYFKHTGPDGVLCIIVGENSSTAKRGAFMQVISHGMARYIHFDICDYYCDPQNLFIRIGESYFTKTGAILNCTDGDFSLTGQINYGALNPITGDIMGFFAHVPAMECVHVIVSTKHDLCGKVSLCGKNMDFTNGVGYIEGDKGRSFPQKYLWLHSNSFKGHDCTFTAAVATIPYGKIKFTGCIIHFKVYSKELCFATYNGVKIIAATKRRLIVEQGDYRLEVRIKATESFELSAPQGGEMNRTILECPNGVLELTLFDKGKLVISATGEHAGIEFVN